MPSKYALTLNKQREFGKTNFILPEGEAVVGDIKVMAQLKKSTSSKRAPVYGKLSSASKISSAAKAGSAAKAAPSKKIITKSQIAAAKKSASVKVTSGSVSKISAKAPANRKSDKKPSIVSATSSRAKPAAKISYAPTNFASNGENVVKLGTDMMRKFMSGEEMKKSSQAFKSAEDSVATASRAFGDAVSASKSNFEACVECGNRAASVSKTIGEQVTSYLSDAIAQNVSSSKELMACRNPKDAMELQSKIFRNNVDGFFNEAAQISDMLFKYASDAAEPINQRVSEASKKFKTAFGA